MSQKSLKRLRERAKQICRSGRGQSVKHIINTLNPVLRGWMHYFQYAQTKRAIEEVDVWVRIRLRGIIWRQWKRPKTRESRLRALGLDAYRAWKSSVNGRGPWWNAGASHLSHALPPKYFTGLGLVSLVATHQHLQCTI